MPANKTSVIQQKIDQAIAFHREARWDDAERLYREVLRKDARNIDALHLMGNLYFLRGDNDMAEKWVRKALKELKRFPLALITLGQIEAKTGREDAAEKHFKEALSCEPNLFDGYLLLARLYGGAGRHEEALGNYKRCLELTPDHDAAAFEYANTLNSLGRKEEAEAAYQQLMQRNPAHLDAVNNLAVQLLHEGQNERAAEVLHSLLEKHPSFAMGWSNLGLAYENMKELEKALKYYQCAIDADRTFANAWANMGNVFLKAKQFPDAMRCFKGALEADPTYVNAYNGLTQCYLVEKDAKEAEALLKQSLLLQPEGNYFASSTYAMLLRDQQRFDESIAMAIKATEADPSNPDSFNTLGWAYNDIADYEKAEAAFRKGLEIDPKSRKVHSNLLMLLTYRMELDHKTLYEEHCRYGKQHKPDSPEELEPLALELRPYRRLRIGYLSPDFRAHVVRNFIQPVIGAHDREKVEVFCYSELEKEKEDKVTVEIKGLTDHWLNTWGMSSVEVANRIRRDRIDVLIELAGHSGNNRLDVIDLHPAPVQVSYLGYITTTGASGMDYRITDPIMTPSGSPEPYSEELYHLDRCYKCYAPAPHEPPVNPEVSPAGEVVFGSLHRISKLTDRTVALWAAVMHAVPRAKLLLARHELRFEENRKSVLALFGRHGVEAERITLDDTYGYKTHMEIYRKIDIGLDPIPVVGGATTAEAMWMGVPVLTLQGEAFRERISSTLLDAVGLGDWIATSPEDYVARAVRFANDYHKRLQIRTNIRDMFMNSPLGDAKGLASALEDAYLDMWHRKLEGTSSDLK